MLRVTEKGEGEIGGKWDDVEIDETNAEQRLKIKTIKIGLKSNARTVFPGSGHLQCVASLCHRNRMDINKLIFEDNTCLASMEPAFAFITEGGCLYLPSAMHYIHKFHPLSKSN